MAITIKGEEGREQKDTGRIRIKQSNTEPEEAAQNIERAKIANVKPDAYKNMKEQLDPEIEAREKMPSRVGKVTKDFVEQDEQHASLAKDDVGILNEIEGTYNYFKQQVFDLPELNREISELRRKQIWEGELTPGEQQRVDALNQIRNQKAQETFGVDNPIIEGAAALTSVGGDFIRSFWENKELAGGLIGSGATLGGLATLGVPIPGARFAGVGAGAATGVVSASAIVPMFDGMKEMSGSIYNELSISQDEQGNPLKVPHERKAKVAIGAGIISGAAQGLAGGLLAKANPLLKRFASPATASKLLVRSPQVMAKMELLGGMLQSTIAEGGAEAVSEATAIVSTEFGKMDESEESFLNALSSLTENENLKRLGGAAALGGTFGGAFTGATGAFGLPGLTERYNEVQTMMKKKVDTLAHQNSMLQIADKVKQTKISKMSPGEMSKFTQQISDSLGLDENIYFDSAELKEAANTPEKQAAIKKAIDKSGQLTKMADQLNQDVPLNRSDAIEILTEFPEVSDIMKDEPGGQTPNQVRDEARNLQQTVEQAEATRKQIEEELGVGVSRSSLPDMQVKEDSLKKAKEQFGENFIGSVAEFKGKEDESFTLRVETEDVNPDFAFNVVAYTAEGERVGSTSFAKPDPGVSSDSDRLQPDPFVNENFRRRGIGKATYDLVRNSGFEVARLDDPNVRTEEGQAFREGEIEKESTIFKEITSEEGLTEEQNQRLQEALEPVKQMRVFENELDYIEHMTFTEVEGVMSQKEAEEFNTRHLDAKEAVDKSLREDVDRQFQTLENRLFRQENADDIQNEIESLDKEFRVIENFRDKTPGVNTERHSRKGFSDLAIDPKTLPEDLKAIYLDDPQLKKRKAFVRGGIDLEESAQLAGVDSGAELLRILKETPTRSQIRKDRKQKEIAIRNRINQDLKPGRLEARDKAFTNKTKIYLRELKHMREKQWPTTRRGIIKIASDVPRLESIQAEARQIVSKMKIKDIKPRIFETGENKSQKMALNDFLGGRFERAFANKEKAARNNEMRKQAINAREKVAKFKAFWKQAKKPSAQKALKQAGMIDAFNEFTSLYRLDGSTRGLTEAKNFQNYVKRMNDMGEYVPHVPDRLKTTQKSVNDMTLEQYEAVSTMGQYMLKKARDQNKVKSNLQKKNELRTMETIREDIEEQTRGNFKYSEQNIKEEARRNMNSLELAHDVLKTGASSISSFKTIISELDGYEPNGYFHRTMGRPIKEARTAKRTEMSDIEKNDRKIVETFYGNTKKFREMYNEFLEVPELADFNDIGFNDGTGRIRKTDLMTLQAYMGDPDARNSIKNFKNNKGESLTPEAAQSILDTHLSENDVAFVQNFLLKRFDRFKDRAFELQRRDTGIEPEAVEGVSFTHRGKVYPGGYYPIRRQILPDQVRANKYFDSLKESGVAAGRSALEMTGMKENDFFAQMRAAEMTKQDRLKERTGSERPLDLNFDNVFGFTEEMLHDLHFREVGADILKILKNGDNAKNMKAVIGPKKYTNLVNSVKDIASKTSEREGPLFSAEKTLTSSTIGVFQKMYAVQAIGANVGSSLIQVDALPTVMNRYGAKSGLYMSRQAAKMGMNLNNYRKYLELAADINPDIKLEMDGVDDAVIKQSYRWISSGNSFFRTYKSTPSDTFARKVKNKLGRGSQKLNYLQQEAVDASFVMVREADRFNRSLVTLSLSEQFLNGDIEGYSKSRVDSMSESERAKTMQSIVQQATDLTQTATAPEDKAPLQKNVASNLFTRFWNDLRNKLNSTIALTDRTRGQLKSGDYKAATQSLLTLGLVSGISKEWGNLLYEEEEFVLNRLSKVDDVDDFNEFAMKSAWSWAKAPLNNTLSSTPLVRDIKYQADLDYDSDYRNVSIPFFKVPSNISMGIMAMDDILDSAIQGKDVNLNDAQRKAILTNLGYLRGGAPTNAIYKAYEALGTRELSAGAGLLGLQVKDIYNKINTYIDLYKDEPDSEAFIKDLEEYQKNLPQHGQPVDKIIPENAKDEMKQALSGGDWKKFNSETTEAGIYQFTEDRWEEITRLAPSLGLTENGRVSRDTSEQEQAMDWVMKDNTRGLMAYDIPVTTENLLGAHKFGFDNFLEIHQAEGNKSLTELLGDEADNPIFEGFKTVNSVKSFLKRQINRSEN